MYFFASQIRLAALSAFLKLKQLQNETVDALSNKDGDAYIDTVVKILIAVVIGALLLWGIYKIMGGDGGVLDQLGEKIKALFDKTQTSEG